MKRISNSEKVSLLGAGILLQVALMFLPHSSIIRAETNTPSTIQSQDSNLLEAARNLVGIEPISVQDLLTVNLIFDGRLPLHNSFILSTPPRLVIELLEVGSTLDEATLLLDDDRVKQIQTQRHPGKLRVLFDLTSLDGISYFLKMEKNRLIVSFKIYSEQQLSQSTRESESASGSPGGAVDSKVEESPGVPIEKEEKGIDLQDGDQQDAYEVQKEKNDTYGEQAVPSSKLDLLLQKPSVLYPKLDAFLQELSKGFSYELRALATQTVAHVSDSPANPLNVLGIPKYTFETNLRPDFYLNYRWLKLMAKPRNIMTWSRIENGIREGESDWDYDLFFNEWLAGIQPFNSFFVSYGRENIQWGPSYLLSPSNPFFMDNGLRNPYREIRGQDFGRMIWIPNMSWSVSFLANTGKGANDLIQGFEPAYAMKLDYTGYKKYFSIIPSNREKDRTRLGAFGGWTITDGLLLYSEASFSQGTNALYPVVTDIVLPSGQFLVELDNTKDNSNDIETVAIFGASYTFQGGPTVGLEYLLNTPGYNDKQADQLLDFTSQFERAISIIPPDILDKLLDTESLTDINLPRLRRHYLNFQFQYPRIWNDLSFFLRYTFNADDYSSQLIPIGQYDFTNHLQAFVVGTINFGSESDEFKFFVDDSYFFGIQYTF